MKLLLIAILTGRVYNQDPDEDTTTTTKTSKTTTTTTATTTTTPEITTPDATIKCFNCTYDVMLGDGWSKEEGDSGQI